jgi:TrmH family RNA methyltransferase
VVDVPWRMVRSLYNKKERELSGLTVAEGPPSVMGALVSLARIETVIVSDEFASSQRWDGFQEALAKHPSPGEVYTVKSSLYERISGTKSPQGVLCVLPFPFSFHGPRRPSPWKRKLYVAGVDIQDPGNVGTLTRTAASAGATEMLFLGDSADPYSPKCIRASAGAALEVNLRAESDPASAVTELVNEGVTIYAAVPSGGVYPWEADFSGDCGVFLGNEGQGLRPEIMEGIGHGLSVPMPGGTESLNVAAASAMILYEVVRQRLVTRVP